MGAEGSVGLAEPFMAVDSALVGVDVANAPGESMTGVVAVEPVTLVFVAKGLIPPLMVSTFLVPKAVGVMSLLLVSQLLRQQPLWPFAQQFAYFSSRSQSNL